MCLAYIILNVIQFAPHNFRMTIVFHVSNSDLCSNSPLVQIQVIGSYGGRARQDLPKLVKLAESGIFNLTNAVTRKYKFEDANKAYEDLNKGNILSRAVVEIM